MDLKNLTQQELLGFARQLGIAEYRGRQLFSWLYSKRVTDFAAMTDLPKDLRDQLSHSASISTLSPAATLLAKDGTCKVAFRLADDALIESVLIPEGNRYTLCLSTQVGCAMGCRFCQTASLGFKRNLNTAEIVNQVLASDMLLPAQEEGGISNLVFMGMGEPLANFDNVLAAIDILKDQRGLDFSERRITVSTCGLLPKLKELGEKTNINLAVSLHAARNEIRDQLMPVNKTYPLAELLRVLEAYPLSRRKRIMIEYILLDGVNDSAEDAHSLAKILRRLRCKINLLPYNNTGVKAFRRPSQDRIDQFQHILWQAGYTVIMRNSRGDEIGAACGQLAGQLAEVAAVA